MRRRRGVPLLHLILAAAVVLAACGGAGPADEAAPPPGRPAGSEPAPEGTDDDPAAGPAAPAPAPGGGDAAVAPARWSPCGDGLDCATVAVPLDHDDPAGPTVELALVRVPASDPARRAGSLFVNPGGPGASGVAMVRNGFRFDADTMARYDLVGFDPRGVGDSDPLGCEPDLTSQPLPDPHPDDPGEADQLDRFARAMAERCARSDGDRLAHLGTYAVARDLDLLRQAVGDEQLSYYGLSYGTLLGLRYLELFPERAGRIVLDGVVDPTATLADLLRQQAEAFERTFQAMAASCTAAPDCPADGLAAGYDRALATVEAGPVDGVGPAELATAVITATYDPAIWGVLRQAIAGAADGGRFAAVGQLSDRYYTSASFAAYAAVSCTDSPVPRGAAGWDALVDDLAAVSPRFGAATANELRSCAHWPVTTDEPPRPVRAEGSGPVLVIGTTGDAATPVENAVAVAEQLADGHLLIHEAEGHTAYGDPCVTAAVRTFLLDGLVPAGGSRC